MRPLPGIDSPSGILYGFPALAPGPILSGSTSYDISLLPLPDIADDGFLLVGLLVGLGVSGKPATGLLVGVPPGDVGAEADGGGVGTVMSTGGSVGDDVCPSKAGQNTSLAG